MFNYAKIDDDNIAYAIVQNTHALGDDASLVLIPKHDPTFIGQRYAAGIWSKKKPFALISEGKVVAVVNEFEATADYVETTGSTAVGWSYVNGAFTAPPAPEPAAPVAPEPNTKLTHDKFLRRLTTQEFKSIRQASKSNADVDMFMYRFERAQEIDLTDPDTIAGVQMMEAAGIFAAGRAATILAVA